MSKSIVFMLSLLSLSVFGQSFAPAPGNPGSTAIYKDSNVIVAWATQVYVQRGYLDIQNPQGGDASYGADTDAVGPADGATVVSLGDSGVAIIQFERPIFDGPGPDFAIFENGFVDGYMEFAFVEVSSDGVNYYRFPATSEIPTATQSDNFTITDCGYVHNLAGKYRVNYGTPFDLADFSGILSLDVQNITHVKLIDVVGSVDSQWGSSDQYGTMINDPYPTAFESGGFDLDAVGVIHQKALGIDEVHTEINVSPNPFSDAFEIEIPGAFEYEVFVANGGLLEQGKGMDLVHVNTLDWSEGCYILYLRTEKGVVIKKIIK